MMLIRSPKRGRSHEFNLKRQTGSIVRCTVGPSRTVCRSTVRILPSPMNVNVFNALAGQVGGATLHSSLVAVFDLYSLKENRQRDE